MKVIRRAVDFSLMTLLVFGNPCAARTLYQSHGTGAVDSGPGCAASVIAAYHCETLNDLCLALSQADGAAGAGHQGAGHALPPNQVRHVYRTGT
jgi:hypothetical protein